MNKEEESPAMAGMMVDARYRLDVLENGDVCISEYNFFYQKQAEIVMKGAAFQTLLDFYNRYSRELKKK